MRHLLNTLYVLTEDSYLSLDGKNVVVKNSDGEIGRVPLHTLESIVCFSRRGASPALLGYCAGKGIAFSFFDYRGRFLAGVHGAQRGNVLLRKAQYQWAEDGERAVGLAKYFILGKVHNGRWVLERALRDHSLRIDADSVRAASLRLRAVQDEVIQCSTVERLRGIEGDAASVYFGSFDELILREKEEFSFEKRSRRPPMNRVNAMLSLFYSVLACDCAAALEGAGLDPNVGLLHALRPGRQSMALDLMEELRPVMVDRFVVTAINNRVIVPDHFIVRETGEVRLSDDGRRRLFKAWQDRKREQIIHPFLAEKVPWGMVPHIQALLLARCLRGDLDGYPPFLWK